MRGATSKDTADPRAGRPCPPHLMARSDQTTL